MNKDIVMIIKTIILIFWIQGLVGIGIASLYNGSSSLLLGSFWTAFSNTAIAAFGQSSIVLWLLLGGLLGYSELKHRYEKTAGIIGAIIPICLASYFTGGTALFGKFSADIIESLVVRIGLINTLGGIALLELLAVIIVFEKVPLLKIKIPKINLPKINIPAPKLFSKTPKKIKEPITINKNQKENARKEMAASQSRIKLPKKTRAPQIKKLFNKKPASQVVSDDISHTLVEALNEYGISGSIRGRTIGPVVTQYKLDPSKGTKISTIISRQDDLARAVRLDSIMVSGTISGTNLIGIDIPNPNPEIVNISDIVDSPQFKKLVKNEDTIPLAIGKSQDGTVCVADLATFPHLLMAGSTGSGKSCGINSFICSTLYASMQRGAGVTSDDYYIPEDIRLILIDPKQIELSFYKDIPHLLTPVVTDIHEAAKVLNWAAFEMERRFKIMNITGVRNIASYNRETKREIEMGVKQDTIDNTSIDDHLPNIMIVIDEYADLILQKGKEVELPTNRLLAKARAAGIHLVIATQRPSVDVISGVLKNNLPTRICFQVSSKIDSRTVIDQMGAEKLLGRGDMLFMRSGSSPSRAHGAFISDSEVMSVVDELKKLGKPLYNKSAIGFNDDADSAGDDSASTDSPTKMEGTYGENKLGEAIEFVTTQNKVSVSLLQRKLRVGYSKASILMEELEKNKYVSSPGTGGHRVVLKKGGET